MHWRLPVKQYKDGKFHISYCPALDIMVQGDTLEAAMNNMDAAVNLFLVHSSFDEVMGHLILVPPVDSVSPALNEPEQHTIPAREAVKLAYA